MHTSLHVCAHDSWTTTMCNLSGIHTAFVKLALPTNFATCYLLNSKFTKQKKTVSKELVLLATHQLWLRSTPHLTNLSTQWCSS